ncbi:DUF3916 domain-containing protein [Smaragdicoccus niigatensis]|uniref:DUF3916 domain-containing protein n=1 Tax=Smaragdicoccus niigatensis TaxID=359359 RepID=UPI00035FFF00|nr:DUF3916 domain-containing protein [Smaragdicoccus niigatensis]
MRRIDPGPWRPDKKLRNKARHMRTLRRWHAEIEDWFPGPEWLDGRDYYNFKVPAYARLLESRFTTNSIRRACINEAFLTAEVLENSELRPPDCRVAVVISTPDMFSSEVAIFFSEDYFERFLPATESYVIHEVVGIAPAHPDLIAPIRPNAPEGLEFYGGTRISDPELSCDLFQWLWSYPRR